MTIKQVMDKIIKINDEINGFWIDADEWAPIDAAELLSKSRLDWQVSLSKCLKLWIIGSQPIEETGKLILAWANLGSLVEGTMKLFLSVYYSDYQKDIEAERKRGKLKDPDCLTLELLRNFFNKRIWEDVQEKKEWNNWLKHIQQRRNAIHAYKNREIGTFEEFFSDVHKYLIFLQMINERLPYPDPY